MPYSQLLTATFKLIWREKTLWLFGLLGAGLPMLANILFTVGGTNWQQRLFEQFDPGSHALRIANQPDLPRQLVREMALFFGLMIVGLLVLGIGYVVNLAMRAATIHEAAYAWRNEPVSVGRGIRQGFRYAWRMFVIDLLWITPVFVVVIAFYGLIFGTIILGGVWGGNSDHPLAAVLGIGGTIMLAICGLFFVLFILMVAGAIFAPLMYQSLVQGQQRLGAALKEGWQLARTSWRKMLAWAIILFVLGGIVAVVQQLVTFPFAMSTMFQQFQSLAESAQGRRGMPVMPTAGLLMASLIGGIVGTFTFSFMQSFGLVLYAWIYRDLRSVPLALPPVETLLPLNEVQS